MTSSTESIEGYEIWDVNPEKQDHRVLVKSSVDQDRNMLNNFGESLRLLDAGGIEFIVVGGVAVALNGYVRATEDVDIIVEPSHENIERLLAVLEGWGDGHARELSVEDFGIELGAVRIIEDFPLDVFTILADRTYDEYLPASPL